MLQTTIDAKPGADVITFTLHVENRGDEGVDLSFSDGQRVRVSVYPATDGTEPAGDTEPVWRSDEGQMFMQMLGSETVPAGGNIEFREKWVGAESGSYLAVGDVVCRERGLQAETVFSV